jgi:mono/diheme cytochrome c family protein
MRHVMLVGLLGLAIFTAACGESTEGKYGADLYGAACARCHGGEGQGGRGPAIGTADSNAAVVLNDDQIRGVIRAGPGRMPAFPRLDDDQVDSLVEHLRLLQSGEEPCAQEEPICDF